ncbi:MAG: hypothetical protein ABJZ55_24595 [Fuerstiella sp.]
MTISLFSWWLDAADECTAISTISTLAAAAIRLDESAGRFLLPFPVSGSGDEKRWQ